jgi:hypothetical protein
MSKSGWELYVKSLNDQCDPVLSASASARAEPGRIVMKRPTRYVAFRSVVPQRGSP